MQKLNIYVKPGSTKGPLVERDDDGKLLVYVKERAIDGKANVAVVELLAKYFDVARSNIEITRGDSSRHKTIILHTV